MVGSVKVVEGIGGVGELQESKIWEGSEVSKESDGVGGVRRIKATGRGEGREEARPVGGVGRVGRVRPVGRSRRRASLNPRWAQTFRNWSLIFEKLPPAKAPLCTSHLRCILNPHTHRCTGSPCCTQARGHAFTPARTVKASMGKEKRGGQGEDDVEVGVEVCIAGVSLRPRLLEF